MNLANDQCGVQVDAVVFADGSYEGDPDSVRAIQAGRDGILASVNYWLDKFSRENPDEAYFAALKAEVEDRFKQGMSVHSKFVIQSLTAEKQPLSVAYWYGRLDADGKVKQMISMGLTGKKSAENYQHIADEIARWKKKIETDVSREKLRAEFPPITEDSVKPEPLAAQQ